MSNTSYFASMVEAVQTPMHFDAFCEPVSITASNGEVSAARGIIKVTSQEETTDRGVGVIIRAEVLIESEFIGQLRATSKLAFRDQVFAVAALAPPVAGFIIVSVSALRSSATHTAALKPAR